MPPRRLWQGAEQKKTKNEESQRWIEHVRWKTVDVVFFFLLLRSVCFFKWSAIGFACYSYSNRQHQKYDRDFVHSSTMRSTATTNPAAHLRKAIWFHALFPPSRLSQPWDVDLNGIGTRIMSLWFCGGSAASIPSKHGTRRGWGLPRPAWSCPYCLFFPGHCR